MKMCKYQTSSRYEALKVLRHPWVTRCTKSNIPETLIESYNKMNVINKFRHLLAVGVALHVFKVNNQNVFAKVKPKIISLDMSLRGRSILTPSEFNL